MVLGTGLIERVFWWRLIARGYGLISPESDGSLRGRPSVDAMRTLIGQVAGATFDGPLPAPDGAYLYHFSDGDHEIVVGWCLAKNVRVSLPAKVVEAVSRDGLLLHQKAEDEVVLGTSPIYFHLA